MRKTFPRTLCCYLLMELGLNLTYHVRLQVLVCWLLDVSVTETPIVKIHGDPECSAAFWVDAQQKIKGRHLHKESVRAIFIRILIP